MHASPAAVSTLHVGVPKRQYKSALGQLDAMRAALSKSAALEARLRKQLDTRERELQVLVRGHAYGWLPMPPIYSNAALCPWQTSASTSDLPHGPVCAPAGPLHTAARALTLASRSWNEVTFRGPPPVHVRGQQPQHGVREAAQLHK